MPVSQMAISGDQWKLELFLSVNLMLLGGRSEQSSPTPHPQGGRGNVTNLGQIGQAPPKHHAKSVQQF